MTKQILSPLFKDPFYYGVLIQKGKEIDLRDLYSFKPAVSEHDYIEVQKLSGNRKKSYKVRRHRYLPLKMMIVCSSCGNHMYAGVSDGNTRSYLFYRCGNKLCTRRKKGIRSKVILDYIHDLLKDGLNLTEDDYHKYYDGLVKISDGQREKLQFELHSKQAVLKDVKGKIKTIR